VGVGTLHLAQAVAILAISTSFAIPVVATVQTGPPGAAGSLSQRSTVFEVRFAWAVALFLLLAALVRRDGGAAFYAHTRVGQGGRGFGCLIDTDNRIGTGLVFDND
jgi:hypothetical protein